MKYQSSSSFSTRRNGVGHMWWFCLFLLLIDLSSAFLPPNARNRQSTKATMIPHQNPIMPSINNYHRPLFLQQDAHHPNENDNEEENENDRSPSRSSSTSTTSTTTTSRRNVLLGSAATAATSFLPTTASNTAANAAASLTSTNDDVYIPAKRPTAYRVDSTIPPTLLSLSTAREQTKILKGLAAGSGTNKKAIVVDTVNLNNILNKAVFGTAQSIQSLLSPDDSRSGIGYASFVCLGVPKETAPEDITLATSLLSTIATNRPKASSTLENAKNMAIGLWWAPLSTQSILNEYQKGQNYEMFVTAMKEAGIDESLLNLYQPLLETFAKMNIDFLALSPEVADLQIVLRQGLQQVDPERRSKYVIDPQGFISLTQDPQFKLYTDRSLLKDYDASEGGNVKEGDFFAQRILAHETAATICAQYAQRHQVNDDDNSDSRKISQPPLITTISPMADVRFLVGGINGRIPRIANNVLGMKKITNDAVTTILCNPSATETLSKSRYLRLEIGTGPDTLDYQSKVADYLWFSKSPKVNMIPRLMN